MKRCILLVPSEGDAEWIFCLDVGLKARGLELVVLSEELATVEHLDDDRRVYLAFHKSFLKPARDAQRAVITAAATRWGQTDWKHDIAALRSLTGRYADALSWPADVYLTDATIEVAAASSTGLEVFPGVQVSVPEALAQSVADNPSSKTDIIEMFRHGMPRPGQSTNWETAFVTAPCYRGGQLTATGPLDMGGPPRPLVKGPYFTLTPGLWKATVRFSLDDLATGNELRIEWGPPEKFVSVRARPKSAGIYQATLVQEWTETGFAEVIVELMNGCIGGQFELLGISVEFLSRESQSAMV